MTFGQSWRARLWGAALAVGALTLGLTAPALTSTPAQADEPPTGENVALASAGGTVTASGQELAGQWGPDLVIDGNTDQVAGAAGSRWSSNTSDDAWIQVNLAEPTVVDHVTIYWEAACAAKYKLQVSPTGEAGTWVDATEAIEPVCGSVDRQELTTTEPVQHVRMQTIERTPIGGVKYGVSMWEFEVWNGPEPTPAVPEASLMPLPAHVEWADDAAEPFTLTADSRILAGQDLDGEAALLAAVLRASTGYDLPIVTGTDGAGVHDVVLTTGDLTAAIAEAGLEDSSLADQPLDDQSETYQLDVSAAGAIITGSSPHGVFNGTQTFLQLLPEFVYSPQQVSLTWAAPAVNIVDGPRYDYRAIMLDPARSFLTVDEVEHIIDALAAYKISALHIHLADDQGWRIEITNDGKDEDDPIDYGRLTEISGKTAMNEFGVTYKDELGHTGYYTQEEYSDIVAYAAERHITVVPEIDLPGHTNAALHAIPQLNTAGSSHEGTEDEPTAPANGTGAVGYSYLDPDNPLTFTFIEHVLGQIAELTPGEYLHIGGDESHSMTSRYGIDVFNEFVARTIDIVHDLGKKPIGWTEISAGTLNAGDAVQYWVGGTADVERAVNSEGAKVLMSRGVSSYIDMKYHPKTPIGKSWACSGDCDFPRYYNWDPAQVIPNVDDSGILGNEAPMWSETIRGGYQAEFLAFPRSLSHAEIGWTQQADRDVADFSERMASSGVRLTAGGWNFYDGNKTAWGYALAGTDVAAAPGRDLDFEVGLLAAPGTKTDGDSVAVDDVDDADSASDSALEGEFTATVDFGDGTPAQEVSFSAEQARDLLHASGVYTLSASHAYAEAGTYTGTITGSEGTVATFTATIAEGTPDPTEPESPWDPETTPSIAFTDDEAAAGARTQVTIGGFEPGTHVELTFGGEPTNSLLPGPDGTLTVYWQVPPGAIDGETTLEAVQGDRTASDTIVVTDGRLALPNPIPQADYTIADVSSEETTGEPAGSGVATAAIDGDPATYWHTKWQGGSDPLPHHITLDLGGVYDVEAFEYTPRQANVNGLIEDYEIYVSTDGETWGEPVAAGSFADGRIPQVVTFEPVEGQYVKLVALTTKAANEFVGAAELRVGGLPADDGGDDSDTGADSGSGGDSDAGADSGSGGDSDAGADSGSGGDSDAGAGSDAGSDTGTDADAGAGTDADAGAGADGADTGAGSDGADAGAAADGANAGAGTDGTDGAADGADGADDGADSTIPPVDEPGLPDTGAPVLPIALLAGLVLIGGATLVLLRRRTASE